MLEPGRISTRQIGILLINAITPTAYILMPSSVYRAAQHDAWLAIILLTCLALGVGLILTTLAQRFPSRTVIQYSEDIVTLVPGKIVGFIFILSLIYVNAFVVREVSDIIKIGFMQYTPLWVLAAGLVATGAYMVRLGLEVLARVCEFILLLGFILTVIIISFIAPEYRLQNLTPLLEGGVTPVLRGTFLAIPFFTAAIIILFIAPYTNQPRAIKKYSLLGIAASGSFLLAITISTVGVLGSATINFNYAILELAAYISLADFIERIDPLLLISWISGCLMEIAVLYYCAVLALSQWLNLKEYQAMILPIGALTTVLALVRWPSIVNLVDELTHIMPVLISVLWVLVPLLLLIIAWLRGKKDVQSQQQK